MLSLLVGLVVGIFIGYRIFSVYRFCSFLHERCDRCNGSGFELGYENSISDCKNCDGSGYVNKKGFIFALLKLIFKIY